MARRNVRSAGRNASGKYTYSEYPECPCDILADAGNPCVAAHSITRALYASYNGPLYQVMRQSDGKTLEIGVVRSGKGDPGGYADAAGSQVSGSLITLADPLTMAHENGTQIASSFPTPGEPIRYFRKPQ